MNTITGRTEDRKKVEEVSTTNRQVEEYEARLGLFYEVAQQASSVSEVSELIDEILRVTQRILHASASSLLLVNEGKGEFYLQAARGEKSDKLKQVKLDLGSGIIGWVARKGMPVISNDVNRDKHFNKDVDEATGFITKSILAAPIVRGKDVIGVLEIINKADGDVFSERDLVVLTRFASTEALILLVSMVATAMNNIKMCQSLHEEYKSTVEALVSTIDSKDLYASGHSRRVREYTLLAANSLTFSPEELRIIEFGALMHDIGKIGISDNIFHKTDPLTDGEWYIMRKHPLKGANIVSGIPIIKKARDIVLYHHERYDGKGYPKGLKGEVIPVGARLVAVADAFDTMTTEHSYRAALSLKEAMGELIGASGTQFCPMAVAAFVSEFQKYKGQVVVDGVELAARAETGKEAGIEPGEEAEERVRKEALETAKEKAEEVVKKEAEKTGKIEAEKKAEREAKKKATKEAEKKAEKEAKKKAKKEAEEKAKIEAGEKAKKEAEERAEKEAEEKAKKEAEKEAKKEAEKGVHVVGTRLYQGEVDLTIRSGDDIERMRQFNKSLEKVKDLKIFLRSWSEEEGNRIVVSLKEPMALGSIISEMPVVEQVYEEESSFIIVLAT